MPKSRSFTDSFLRDYSGEHLFYEYVMLARCADFMANQHRKIQCSPGDIQSVRNILLESFAIHLRNLIGFYYGDQKTPVWPTDVLAIDYFADGEWQKQRPPITKSLKDAELQAHKQIAHLTTERYSGDDERKAWNFVSLNEEIKEITKVFLAGAMEERLATNVVRQNSVD